MGKSKRSLTEFNSEEGQQIEEFQRVEYEERMRRDQTGTRIMIAHESGAGTRLAGERMNRVVVEVGSTLKSRLNHQILGVAKAQEARSM
jgi:hypothetical protein